METRHALHGSLPQRFIEAPKALHEETSATYGYEDVVRDGFELTAEFQRDRLHALHLARTETDG